MHQAGDQPDFERQPYEQYSNMPTSPKVKTPSVSASLARAQGNEDVAHLHHQPTAIDDAPTLESRRKDRWRRFVDDTHQQTNHQVRLALIAITSIVVLAALFAAFFFRRQAASPEHKSPSTAVVLTATAIMTPTLQPSPTTIATVTPQPTVPAISGQPPRAMPTLTPPTVTPTPVLPTATPAPKPIGSQWNEAQENTVVGIGNIYHITIKLYTDFDQAACQGYCGHFKAVAYIYIPAAAYNSGLLSTNVIANDATQGTTSWNLQDYPYNPNSTVDTFDNPNIITAKCAVAHVVFDNPNNGAQTDFTSGANAWCLP